ncbi:unnamed protein product [Discula destructiva]
MAIHHNYYETSNHSTESLESLDEKTALLRPEQAQKSRSQGRNWLTQRAEQKRLEVQEIERMFDRIQLHRKRWQMGDETWRQAIDMARRRQEAWSKGTEVDGYETHLYWSFDTNSQYVLAAKPTNANLSRLSPPEVLDFRTPEGRAAAVAWYEECYRLIVLTPKSRAADYEKWEKVYRAWKAGGYCWLMRTPIRRALLTLHVPEDIAFSAIGWKRLPNVK